MHIKNTAPPPSDRPKFWRYYRERDLTSADVGRIFGRSREWVRLITLPFDNGERRIPDAADVARIHEWSGGEVGAADWYPANLSGPAPAVSEEASA